MLAGSAGLTLPTPPPRVIPASADKNDNAALQGSSSLGAVEGVRLHSVFPLKAIAAASGAVTTAVPTTSAPQSQVYVLEVRGLAASLQPALLDLQVPVLLSARNRLPAHRV